MSSELQITNYKLQVSNYKFQIYKFIIMQEQNTREFKLTTVSLKNKTTVYLIIALLAIAGSGIYVTMAKEIFPEVSLPTVFIKTVYPGNSPADMENLVTRQLEKQISTIKGLKEVRSNSTQDNSDVFAEFNSDVDIDQAVEDIKDAVDKAKNDLPTDLPADPMVFELDPSEFPVLNINISGDFSLDEFRKYSEQLQDEIESIDEVSKVNIKGIEEKLIRLNLDKSKMDAFQLTFDDIESAVKYENMTISGGDLIIGNTRRSVRTTGEFKNLREMEDIIVKSEKGNVIYLKDVLENGTITDGYKDALSYARLNGQTVVSLQVIKKSGENLIECNEQIFSLLEHAQKSYLPQTMSVHTTNDQSDMVRMMIENLENSIIMGILFVMFVLYFFLGTRNAMFVGFSIPMSMLLSFVVLGLMGATINMIVLFSLVLALGMLVDNAIVVIENYHRFRSEGMGLFDAAKRATGEIAWAIISSTLTTLAAFFPLMFWPGIMGNFMYFLPLTLIIVLTSSLLVALVIIPTITLLFKKEEQVGKHESARKPLIIAGSAAILAVPFYLGGVNALGNLLAITVIITLLNHYVFLNMAQWFQNSFFPKLENFYLRLLKFALRGRNPIFVVFGTLFLLFATIIFMGIRKPNVGLFPYNEPKYLIIKSQMPVGTDITGTDILARKIEMTADSLIKLHGYDGIVESMLTTVGQGAVGENEFAIGTTPNRTVTTVNFVEFKDRGDKATGDLHKILSDELIGKYPGVITSIEKNRMGPPTGKAISIELKGENFEKLLVQADTVMQILNSANIPGVEGLKLDLDLGKPELIISINRENARRYGLSTGQVASTIRTALFGKEVSDFKIGEEEYPIQIQLSESSRNDINVLLNQVITFRDKTGKLANVPVSSVADFKYTNSLDVINRIDEQRVITLSSNLLADANGTAVNQTIAKILNRYDLPEGYSYELTGEQEQQKETSSFLMRAMLIAVALITLILVAQFNSIAKALIIMATVPFSTIGVFGGLATFKMDFVILMTGIGIVSLAGVVVNNAIVLVDYIDYLKRLLKQKRNLPEDSNLPMSDIEEIIKTAGKTRLKPVLLTAITTILGLVPMAVGFNIDFAGMLSDFAPEIYFGGDNSLFWSPMAWTVIFGLTFATFLTLILVPVMYLIGNRVKLKFKKNTI